MAASSNGWQTDNLARSASTLINGTAHLPGGACNFRELSRGVKSPVCGCKRFWLDVSNPVSHHGATENAWCFCGHHACFHNAVSQQTQRLASQQPSLIATAPSTIEDVSRNTPEGYVSVNQAGAPSKAFSGLGIRPGSRPQSQSQSQSINTRIWNALNGFARGQEGGGGDDNDSARLPSTAVSFTGDVIAAPRPMDPPLFIPAIIPSKPAGDDFPGSATEIATPSIAGTPDLRVFVPPGTQNHSSPSHPPLTAASSPKQLSLVDSGHVTQSLLTTARQMPHEEIINLLQAHGQRLAALEGLSFSQVPIEEINEKFELFDGRLLDLEQWRGDAEEREKQQSDMTALDIRHSLPRSRKRRLLPAEASSFTSDDSFDVTAAAHAEAAVLATIATNAEIGPRIEELESRVADLERMALPTHAQPWEVEVVFLPWGRMLRGIWFSAEDATQHSTSMSHGDLDEWAGTQSQLKTSFRSSSSNGAWTTESIQAWAEDAQDWLSPKACGPSGSVFQRLASRGFVRLVSLHSADARHINEAVTTVFKDVLTDTQAESDEATSRYLALSQRLIPLRKIRKSTRLRFLNPAEMVTPAIWTARFLETSVLMKVGDGHRRLYITTPQAYLQGQHDGFSWPDIRKMAPRDADGEVPVSPVDPSIAIEACWSYNDKIDHIPSLHTSFASHISRQSVWSTKSQQSTNDQGQGAGQLTPALSSRDPRLLPMRRTSLPASASGGESANDAVHKRRVASFESATRAPLVAAVPAEASKRRRLSSSQEAEKRGVNFTPRWSREPPSPFYSEHANENRSQAASSSRNRRGNTPFAYATPHSNSHFIERVDIPGDGDTEHDSDAFDDDRADDDEWNGMEGKHDKPVMSGASSIAMDESDDDDSLDSDKSLCEEDEEMD